MTDILFSQMSHCFTLHWNQCVLVNCIQEDNTLQYLESTVNVNSIDRFSAYPVSVCPSRQTKVFLARSTTLLNTCKRCQPFGTERPSASQITLPIVPAFSHRLRGALLLFNSI